MVKIQGTLLQHPHLFLSLLFLLVSGTLNSFAKGCVTGLTPGAAPLHLAAFCTIDAKLAPLPQKRRAGYPFLACLVVFNTARLLSTDRTPPLPVEERRPST